MATYKMCNFQCGNFPSLSQPQCSVSQPVLVETLVSLQPILAAAFGPIAACGASEVLSKPLGSYSLLYCKFGKLPLGKQPLGKHLIPFLMTYLDQQFTHSISRESVSKREVFKFNHFIFFRCAEGLHFSEDIGTCVWARESGRDLSILVYLCLSISFLVYLVYPCVSLSIFVYPCPSMPILVYPCLSLTILVYLCYP